MPGLLLMLPITILIAFAFLAFFFWSVKNGDFEDIEMISHKILNDDEEISHITEKNTQFNTNILDANGKEIPYNFIEENTPFISNTQNSIKQIEMYIEGIHCASCVMQINQMLKPIEGITSIFINSANSRTIIEWDTKIISLYKIASIIYKAGYLLKPIQFKSSNTASKNILKKLTVAGFFAGNNMLFSVSLYTGFFTGIDEGTKNLFHVLSWVFATPVLLYSASDIFKNAWKALKNHFLGMDTLIAAGLLLAYGYSVYITLTSGGEAFFDAVCFIPFVLLIGRFLQEKLKEHFAVMQDNLCENLPNTVRIKTNNEVTQQDIRKIKPGDICIVYPGEMIPIDGILLSDNAEVDESIITGESKPIYKKKNDGVIAGAFCLINKIEVRSTVFASNNTISAIQKLTQKSFTLIDTIQDLPILQWVYRSFTLIIFICASIAFVYWKYYLHADMGNSFKVAITLLIVACPCSIGLAIPTAIVAALKSAFTKGILIKNETILHYLNETEVVIFDKTGTLTKGLMCIKKSKVLDNTINIEQANEIAGKISKQANIKHPITNAFSTFFDLNTQKESFRKSKYIHGMGIECEQNDKIYYLGSRAFVRNLGFEINSIEQSLNTEVFLACYDSIDNTKTLLCLFELEDEIREESIKLIQQLQKSKNKITNKKRIILLTGDNEYTATNVAKELNIQEYYFNCTPQKKLDFIKETKKNTKGKVVMIGDGMNDAPSLAEAHIGMSFIRSSEISVSSGDILFVGKDLPNLLYLFDLAKKTKNIIYQNLLFSTFYNLVFIPLAFYGLMLPLTGAIAMSLSSLIVLLNSLRIR